MADESPFAGMNDNAKDPASDKALAYWFHRKAYEAGTKSGNVVTLPCLCACGFQSVSFSTERCAKLEKRI